MDRFTYSIFLVLTLMYYSLIFLQVWSYLNPTFHGVICMLQAVFYKTFNLY